MTNDRATIAPIKSYIESCDVQVHWRRLKPDTPAMFDGLSIVLNDASHESDVPCYLAHSFGSIVGWWEDVDGVTRLFDELRGAKKAKDLEPERFERALARFRAFEERASEFMIGALRDAGCATLGPDVSEFFRADLEAITIFHRTGTLPVWARFYASWRRDLQDGRRGPRPFAPRAIPPSFRPVRIELQEVKQGLSIGN